MTNSDVCAVIVTYNPDPTFWSRTGLIAPQLGAVVVVDNHSEAQPLLRQQCAAAGYQFTANPDNLGVAAALNQGVRWARDHGFRWVLTLDQDSEAGDRLVAGLCAVRDRAGPGGPVGMVGANYFDTARQRPLLPPEQFGQQPARPVPAVITSGSLLSVDAFAAVGPFREDFFIDSVDIEYCLRLHQQGFRVLLTRAVLMAHAVGHPSWHRLLWKRVACSNHSPLRRYYITRNRLVLAKMYLGRQPRWALRHLRGLCRHCVLALLFEQHRAAKLRAMALGVGHALTGRLGPLADHPWLASDSPADSP